MNHSELNESDMRHIYGKHETQESNGYEADLHEHYAGCRKNPSHSQFIPIKDFSIQHLPPDCQDLDLYELIRVVADLTVRVDVKWTSSNRPAHWPGTSIPYPFCNIKHNSNMRTGTGSVRAIKYTNGFGLDKGLCGRVYETNYKTCPCEKCEISGQKKNTWWEIIVKTAAHVVFDREEASHATCRLFFDGHDSPVVILEKLRILDTDIEGDSCMLIYDTCDNVLGDQIFNMSEHYYNLLHKTLHHKFKQPSNFTFIVSHPHGCPKQVSLGNWTDHYKVGECDKYHKSKLTYTTCTCPGSSGAKVYSPGFIHLVHSGTLSSLLNYSSTGLYPKNTLTLASE